MKLNGVQVPLNYALEGARSVGQVSDRETYRKRSNRCPGLLITLRLSPHSEQFNKGNSRQKTDTDPRYKRLQCTLRAIVKKKTA